MSSIIWQTEILMAISLMVILVVIMYEFFPIGNLNNNFKTLVGSNNKIIIMNKFRGFKSPPPKTTKVKLEFPQKIKAVVNDPVDLNNYAVPDGYTIYYFPQQCPSYKTCPKIIDVVNGLKRYFVPEIGHVIVVSDKHVWSENPDNTDLTVWKL